MESTGSYGGLIAKVSAGAEKGPVTNGIDYVAFTSSSGGSDRMMLLVRSDRFEVVGTGARELASGGDSITFPGGNSRRPFVVTLRDPRNDGLMFRFMVNHLTRGNQLARRRQAEGLREWARNQELPIIAAGDYNFDFRNLTGNQSMSIFLRREANDGGKFVWDWVMPGVVFEIEGEDDASRSASFIGRLVDTNWSGNGTSDDYRDSLLDFVFVGQGARDWASRSTVIVRSGDFPDDVATSDHRPVEAILKPDAKSIDAGGPRE
jgi:endonuclease/exonuclease/phosphatase family metal-dependent hydrolase